MNSPCRSYIEPRLNLKGQDWIAQMLWTKTHLKGWSSTVKDCQTPVKDIKVIWSRHINKSPVWNFKFLLTFQRVGFSKHYYIITLLYKVKWNIKLDQCIKQVYNLRRIFIIDSILTKSEIISVMNFFGRLYKCLIIKTIWIINYLTFLSIK